jgi:hypothetical protein
MELFHGGCHGCNMQSKVGIKGCVGCQYFEGDWNLPNLNDEHAKQEARLNDIRRKARLLAETNKEQDMEDEVQLIPEKPAEVKLTICDRINLFFHKLRK